MRYSTRILFSSLRSCRTIPIKLGMFIRLRLLSFLISEFIGIVDVSVIKLKFCLDLGNSLPLDQCFNCALKLLTSIVDYIYC